MGETTGLTSLLNMCAITDNRKATLNAVMALATLAVDTYVKDLIADHPGRANVLMLCQNADEEIRSYAVKAVGALSEICDVGLVLEAMEQGAESSVALAKYY